MDDEKTVDARTPAIYVGWISAGLFALVALVLAIGIQIGPLGALAWPHMATAAILMFTGAEGFHAVRAHRRRRAIDERLPDLLRQLSTNHTSGLTIAAAIEQAAEGDYGDLTPELRIMAAQLSFNAPLTEVLDAFAVRTGSRLARRTVALLHDAIRSGARTTDALEAAARDAAALRELQESRDAQLGQYVAIVYLAFGVFLLVVFALSEYFVSRILGGEGGGTSPSVETVFTDPELQMRMESLFVWAAAVSGAGSGIVIGALLRGRPASGLHHSFILTLVGYLVMVLAIFIR